MSSWQKFLNLKQTAKQYLRKCRPWPRTTWSIPLSMVNICAKLCENLTCSSTGMEQARLRKLNSNPFCTKLTKNSPRTSDLDLHPRQLDHVFGRMPLFQKYFWNNYVFLLLLSFLSAQVIGYTDAVQTWNKDVYDVRCFKCLRPMCNLDLESRWKTDNSY